MRCFRPALIAFTCVGLRAAAALPVSAQETECPTVAAVRAYRPPEATRVHAMDGSLLADLSPERRTVVSLQDMPPTITNGFVAVEDRRFWEHDGVDMRGVGRAMWRNLTSLSLAEGFSTITMQLGRNIFPEAMPRADKLRRKICELKLAGEIEDEFSKREILQLYINQVYMGDGRYGVEEASRAYFGKTAKRLTLGEAALLVGIVKNPEGYNPRRDMARAIQRRNIVLDVMVRETLVTAAAAARAKAEPLKLAPPIDAAGGAPWVIAAVRSELRDRFGDDAAVRGLRVFTGIDPAVQKAARDELVAQIRRIESGTYGKWPHPKPNGTALAGAPRTGSQYLQGMVIVLDARTGAVRALVGGRDFVHSSYDRAFLARRQPGSTFKPIVYAAGLQAGLSPAAFIATTPISISLGAGTPSADVHASRSWQPDDLVADSVTSLTLRDALVQSSNHAAVRVGEHAGIEGVTAAARALGITTPIPAVPSIYLGSAGVTPAELAAAYAALGNGGRRVTPTLITRVEDAHGNVKWQAPRNTTQAIDSGVAYITTSMLQDAVDRGTGTAVRRDGFWLPAAGKTGTTNDAKDVWFVGMTPDLAAAVWLGFDQPKQILPNAFGGNLAAPVWAATMKAAYVQRATPAAWAAPASLISVPIDAKTGQLADADCPPADVRIEYFMPGTEPVDYCPLHRRGLLQRLIRWQR